MLRQCAACVERNEFDPILYKALGALHAYTGEFAGAKTSTSMQNEHAGSSSSLDHEEKQEPDFFGGATTNGRANSTVRSAFCDVPDLFEEKTQDTSSNS
eukprot:12013609-Ditylum_brightwellii.AAC.1